MIRHQERNQDIAGRLLLLFSIVFLAACSAPGPPPAPTLPRPEAIPSVHSLRSIDGPRPASRTATEPVPATTDSPTSPFPATVVATSAPVPGKNEGLTAMDLEMLAEISQALGLELDGSENLELLAAIETWMGTPYRYGGCSRFGVDCSCLIQTLYDEVFDIEISRTSRRMFETLSPVETEALQEGDILCFRSRRGRRIGHVGLYLKDDKFVHASRSNGVTISDMKERYYRKRFVAARRVIPSTAMKVLRLLTRRNP